MTQPVAKRPAGVCKDCWADYVVELDFHPATPMPRWRPAPKPGPRCVTHDRAFTQQQKSRAHDRKVESGFGIPAELYWALYEFQGRKCAILHCRATGKTKHLAVDHDHSCCPGRTSCGACVRGLLCGPHNEMFGRNGDDPAVFYDMGDYLNMSTMDRYRMSLGRNAALEASQTATAAHLRSRNETCPASCQLRDVRHVHGTRMYEPLPALQGRAEGEQLDGNTGAGGVKEQ